jgi:hypothetical protein
MHFYSGPPKQFLSGVDIVALRCMHDVPAHWPSFSSAEPLRRSAASRSAAISATYFAEW